MKVARRNSARIIHCPTWREFAYSLAQHTNGLHQSALQTKGSRTKIERWPKQLGTFPTTRATERAQREGEP